MSREQELDLSRWYRVIQRKGLDIPALAAEKFKWDRDDFPVIYATSPAVGAFAASILAHSRRIGRKEIETALRDAATLALAENPATTAGHYRNVLSASSTIAHSEWDYFSQPGGGVAKRLLWSSTSSSGWPFDYQVAAIAEMRRFMLSRIKGWYGDRRPRQHAYITAQNFTFLDSHMICWPNSRFAVIALPPTRVTRNNNRLVHSTDRLAIQYKDGWGVAMVSGIRVKPEYVLHPTTLTVGVINAERNVETRRALIELMGYDKWIKATGARCIHDDVDQFKRPRKLWELPGVQGRVRLLEVFNSTPEQDGKYKKYFLQVPPNIGSVQQGLSWMLHDQHAYRNVKFRLET